MPPDHIRQAQEAEAFQRTQQRGTPNPEGTTPPVADTTVPEDLPRSQQTPVVAQEIEQPQVQRPTLRKDNARDAIAARFRQQRVEDTTANDDVNELRNFAHNGIPPEMVAQEVHSIDADKIAAQDDEGIDPDRPAERQQAQEPVVAETPVVVRRKVVVRGQEHELTDEELVAAAQKGLAGDSYMDEARRTLDEVKSLRRDLTTAPGSQQPQHTPAAQNNGQTTEPLPTPAADEHPDQELVQVIEQVQFGDPAQAAKALNDVINRRVVAAAGHTSQQATQVAMQNERIRDEAERSQRFLQDFERDNPDLAQDEFASAAMEKHLYRLQREDILKLVRAYGKDESQVPTDPKTIANWHLFYRTKGHDVRDVPALLKQARDNFVTWRGTKSAPQPAPSPNPAASTQNRVVVNRTAQRQAIPQQPTRTVTPRPDSQANPPQQRDRSAIVRDMIKTRSAPRRIVGVG